MREWCHPWWAGLLPSVNLINPHRVAHRPIFQVTLDHIELTIEVNYHRLSKEQKIQVPCKLNTLITQWGLEEFKADVACIVMYLNLLNREEMRQIQLRLRRMRRRKVQEPGEKC